MCLPNHEAVAGLGSLCGTTTEKWSRARIQWAVQFTGLPSRLSREPKKEPTAGLSNTTGSQLRHCVLISLTKKISPARWPLITHHQSILARLARYKGTRPLGA